jgi:hypothetical protein
MKLETEATLQAEFYHACRLIDLTCALEVTTPAGRVDCMILDKTKTMLLAIVEVKDSPTAFLNSSLVQIHRYKTLGVPVYGLCPRNCAHRLAATIKRKHQFPNGVLLSKFDGQKSYRRKFIREFWENRRRSQAANEIACSTH